MNKPMRVVVYARTEQPQAEELVRQMFDLLKFVTANGYTLAGNLQESTGDQSANRPRLLEILEYLRSVKADAIVVQKLPRISTDPEQLYCYLCDLQDARAKVLTTDSDIHEDLFHKGVGNRLLSRAARHALPLPWEEGVRK